MTKKGDVWVSAIMYIGLGIALLAVILTAGMPVINKVKDKNIALQTKDIMLKLDDTIRTTLNEGPGSQRTLNIEIGKGDFTISQDGTIKWIFKTTVLLSQPKQDVKEGNLNIRTEDPINKEYTTTYTLDYSQVSKLKLDSPTLKINGKYPLVIANQGVLNLNELPTVYIKAI